MLLCCIRSDIHTIQCACGHIAGRLTTPVFFFRKKPVHQKICLICLSFSKPWMGISRYIHSTQFIQVHGSDPVIIGTISARITDIFMDCMMSVFFMNPSAFGTSLRSICRRYFDHVSTALFCFISKQLFQLIKCPGPSLHSLCLGSFGKVIFFKADTF